MQLDLLHGFGDIFDENLALLFDVLYFFFESECSTLFSTNFEVSDLFTHFDIVFKFEARYFHKTFEKLFFYVSINYRDFIEHNAGLFFHNAG